MVLDCGPEPQGVTVPSAHRRGTFSWLRVCAGRAHGCAGGPACLCPLMPSQRASQEPTAPPPEKSAVGSAVGWVLAVSRLPGTSVGVLSRPERPAPGKCQLVLWRPELSPQRPAEQPEGGRSCPACQAVSCPLGPQVLAYRWRGLVPTDRTPCPLTACPARPACWSLWIGTAGSAPGCLLSGVRDSG